MRFPSAECWRSFRIGFAAAIGAETTGRKPIVEEVRRYPAAGAATDHVFLGADGHTHGETAVTELLDAGRGQGRATHHLAAFDDRQLRPLRVIRGHCMAEREAGCSKETGNNFSGMHVQLHIVRGAPLRAARYSRRRMDIMILVLIRGYLVSIYSD
jgi:hypothetical protein